MKRNTKDKINKGKGQSVSAESRQVSAHGRRVIAAWVCLTLLFALLVVAMYYTGTGIVPAIFLSVAVVFFVGSINYAALAGKHKFIGFAFGIFLAVLFMQISFNAAYPFDLDSGERLNGHVIAVRVLSSSFQTFTLDADYVSIIAKAETVFAGAGRFFFMVLFVLMVAVAPATGGFVIFAILSQIFPRVHLCLSNVCRTKYVFSELNEYSVATAESIAAKRRAGRNGNGYRDEEWASLKSSVIIFTDAYADTNRESGSELLARAKKIGAVCLKDDINELNLRWWWHTAATRKVVYFLMDNNEENNLKDAAAILSADGRVNRWAKLCGGLFGWLNNLQKATKLELFVFTRNRTAYYTIKSSYDAIVSSYANNRVYDALKRAEETRSAPADMPAGLPRRARKCINALRAGWNGKRGERLARLTEKYRKKCLDISFKTINEYKNLVYHLISGYSQEPSEQRNRGASYPLYWGKGTGRGDCKLESLNIVVIGGGRIGKEFIKAAYWCGQMLNFDNDCCCKKGGVIPFRYTKLKITVLDQIALTETAEQLKFEMPEVFSSAARSYCTFRFFDVRYGTREFADKFNRFCRAADYVVVALGDDELNIQAAHWAKQILDRVNLGVDRQIPVNFVVENSELCLAVNASINDLRSDGGECCILNAFGSVSDRYDIANIRFTRAENLAYSVDAAHGGRVSVSQFLMDEYNRNSSIASALHLPYKLVSMHELSCRSRLDEKHGRYANSEKVIKNLVNEMYWLEHRRWNAYMRAEGYRCPSASELYKMSFRGGVFVRGMHRNVNLRLHACLVESGELFTDIGEKKLVADNSVTGMSEAGDMPLQQWLPEHVHCASGGDEKIDNLDRLGAIFNDNFKSYDIDVVSALFSDIVMIRIRSFIEDCFSGGKVRTDDFADAVSVIVAKKKDKDKICFRVQERGEISVVYAFRHKKYTVAFISAKNVSMESAMKDIAAKCEKVSLRRDSGEDRRKYRQRAESGRLINRRRKKMRSLIGHISIVGDGGKLRRRRTFLIPCACGGDFTAVFGFSSSGRGAMEYAELIEILRDIYGQSVIYEAAEKSASGEKPDGDAERERAASDR